MTAERIAELRKLAELPLGNLYGELLDALEAAQLDSERLRKLLWIRHGCSISALYGDDGELQCGRCLIDFKRLTAEKIESIFQRNNDAARAAVKENRT